MLYKKAPKIGSGKKFKSLDREIDDESDSVVVKNKGTNKTFKLFKKKGK